MHRDLCPGPGHPPHIVGARWAPVPIVSLPRARRPGAAGYALGLVLRETLTRPPSPTRSPQSVLSVTVTRTVSCCRPSHTSSLQLSPARTSLSRKPGLRCRMSAGDSVLRRGGSGGHLPQLGPSTRTLPSDSLRWERWLLSRLLCLAGAPEEETTTRRWPGVSPQGDGTRRGVPLWTFMGSTQRVLWVLTPSQRGCSTVRAVPAPSQRCHGQTAGDLPATDRVCVSSCYFRLPKGAGSLMTSIIVGAPQLPPGLQSRTRLTSFHGLKG